MRSTFLEEAPGKVGSWGHRYETKSCTDDRCYRCDVRARPFIVRLLFFSGLQHDALWAEHYVADERETARQIDLPESSSNSRSYQRAWIFASRFVRLVRSRWITIIRGRDVAERTRIASIESSSAVFEATGPNRSVLPTKLVSSWSCFSNSQGDAELSANHSHFMSIR